MESIKKQSDTGMSDFGQHGDDLSPNVHNEHIYNSNDAWSDDRDFEDIKNKPGLNGEGDYSLDNRNPAIMNGFNYGKSRHDELETKKLPYGPADQKKFDKDDLDTITKGFKWGHADLQTGINKQARIVKTPNKEEYKILSEKGKTLGTYKSRKQAEERLKQIEMFKHMEKKADYFDWKGQAKTTEQLGTPEKVVPADDKRVKPYGVPETPTSSDNVEGYNQTDSSLAVAENFEVDAKVIGDVKGKGVTPDVKDGSSGFNGTRGGRGARGHLFYYGVTRVAATQINMVPAGKTSHQDASRNDQSPANPFLAAKSPTSYSSDEKREMSSMIQKQKPISTSIPSTTLDRLYDVDSEKMVEGTEFGTWDFFITPTNQNVNTDVLTDKEKQESSKSKNNVKY